MLSPTGIDAERQGPSQPEHVIQAQRVAAAQAANQANKSQVQVQQRTSQKLLVISNKSGSNNTSGNEHSGDTKNQNRL